MDGKCYTLLTGATGLVGQSLLRELIRHGRDVAVVVRANRFGSAEDRIDTILNRLEKEDKRHYLRPMVIEGDLTAPGLGICKDSRDWIAHRCGTAMHCAANVSFKSHNSAPEEEPFRTNVTGTREFAELSQMAGIDQFHYISSAYVCGKNSGRILEQPAQNGPFSNDYEQSKYTAEQLLHSMNFERLVIYRPSIVVNTSPGAAQFQDRTIHQAFSMYEMLSVKFGLPEQGEWSRKLGLTGNERKNIVPVDWVAQAVIAIFKRTDLKNGIYHLTSTEGTSVDQLEAAFRNVMLSRGLISASQQKNAVAENTLNFETVVAPFVATYAPYFKNDPEFDKSKLTEVLATSGIEDCPSIGQEEIEKLAEFQNPPNQQRSGQPSPKKQANVNLGRDATTSKTLWKKLLQHQETPLVSDWCESENGFGMGILLTGISGGSWTLRTSESAQWTIERGEAVDTQARVYTTSAVWDQLISGKLSWENAIASGKVILENDGQMNVMKTFQECLQTIVELVSHATKQSGKEQE